MYIFKTIKVKNCKDGSETIVKHSQNTNQANEAILPNFVARRKREFFKWVSRNLIQKLKMIGKLKIKLIRKS